jgi:hypothetical protein
MSFSDPDIFGVRQLGDGKSPTQFGSSRSILRLIFVEPGDKLVVPGCLCLILAQPGSKYSNTQHRIRNLEPQTDQPRPNTNQRITKRPKPHQFYILIICAFKYKTQFNSKLTRTADLEEDELEWISQAARGTLLKGVKSQYPNIPPAELHYTSHDWKLHHNLSVIRSLRIKLLTNRIETKAPIDKAVRRKAEKRIKTTQKYAATPVSLPDYQPIGKALRAGDENAALVTLNTRIDKLARKIPE